MKETLKMISTAFNLFYKISYLLALSLFFLSPWSLAEQKKTFSAPSNKKDPFELHYMVLNSTEIPESVARSYQLKRSGKVAFINISILQMHNETYGTPTFSKVEGIYRNLLDQRHKLTFKEVSEKNAVYYLAQFPFDDKDVYRFSITAQPNCESITEKIDKENHKSLKARCTEQPLTLEFSQKLYHE